ncbi:MAG: hypothetical protein KJ077_39465 [Anaerolineae bacterium]|nr:hypothetical protein [Anaerolineae bacterium]
MFKLAGKTNWVTGLLIFSMPVMLVFFLGSQMAYSQVKSQFETYQTIPEVTRLADLESIAAGRVVMLRGQIAAPSMRAAGSELLVFQQRPAAGREVRFGEEFSLIFPEFSLQLPDGLVKISPSLTRERVIQHELHTVGSGEDKLTGFRPGDNVTVQGEWQPATTTLSEVTGITGADKAGLMAEWQEAFQKVGWVRNGLGLLTLLGLILLVVRLRQARINPPVVESEVCPPPKTGTAPTA